MKKYGLNAFSGNRLTLTSQLPLVLFLGSFAYPIGPVSHTITSRTPPLVFVRCTAEGVAWSIPRIHKSGIDTWVVTFAPLPYLLDATDLVPVSTQSGQFELYVFGAKTTVPSLSYGAVINTANLTAGPLAVDAQIRLDLNAREQEGLEEDSKSGRLVEVPGASLFMAICANVGRNTLTNTMSVIAEETEHYWMEDENDEGEGEGEGEGEDDTEVPDPSDQIFGIPIGVGTFGNYVTSFQGVRKNAVQPRQYMDYCDILTLQINKYV